MAQVVQINPGILSWARETAGLSLEEAADKLGLKSSGTASAAEKLDLAERGERPVSRSMLEKAVSLYRRPLVMFYLPKPPERAERGEDFRTVSGPHPREDAILDALIRDVRTRQQLLREVLIDDEDTQPLPFIGSSKMEEGARSVADKIRVALGVTIEAQRRARDAAALFGVLRAAAEKMGVYVLLLGDLGSHHSDLGEEVFRGIALADDIAPFVVINDNDAAPARSFSLMHELAHIWIGASGVSGPLKASNQHAVERFCNEVAGTFLLPPEALHALSAVRGAAFDTVLSLTNDVARAWNVSQGVVVYRLLQNGWIAAGMAATLFDTFSERWRVQKARERELRDPEDQGPGYYVVRRARLGAGLMDTVRRALQGEVLTHTKAARILGVSPTAVDKLLRERPRLA
jgi:Zn-dependent peptidase ImmA (M78 family)